MAVLAPVRLDPSQVDEAAAVLRRAFDDDPIYGYLVPDPARRTAIFVPLFAAAIRYALAHGEAWATAEAVTGVATWVGTAQPIPSAEGFATAGIGAATERCTTEEAERMAAAVGCFKAAHARLMPDPHWYLYALGVEPARQRTGIGSAVLRPMLERADAEGMGCYLETGNPANVPYYERHGFAVLEEATIPGSDVRAWMMRRDPKR